MSTVLANIGLMSVEDYLAFEAKSKVRHEYMDGEIIAMAGASRNHSLIASNINRHVGNQVVSRGCEVHQSDLRVRVRETHYVYPDVVVVCGEVHLAPGVMDTLLNPTVVFEVLSKSTEYRDRHEKAADYFALDSVREFVLVSQRRMSVEHFVRQGKKEWRLMLFDEPDEGIFFPSLECRLKLAQIYELVKLPALKAVPDKRQKNAKRRG